MKTIIFALTLTFAVALAADANASRCKTDLLEKAYQEAEVIFVGNLVDRDKYYSKETGEFPPVGERELPIETLFFEPIRIWKGSKKDAEEVTNAPWPMLQPRFEVGKTYLVFLQKQHPVTGLYALYPCSYAQLDEYAYRSILLLDQLTPSGDVQTYITGRTPKNTDLDGGLPNDEHMKHYNEIEKKRVERRMEWRKLRGGH